MKKDHNMKLILASQSPRRKKVLEESGYSIVVDASHADEESVKADNIREKVIGISRLKANTVAKRYNDGIILAIDTMVHFNGQEIGQQKTKTDAIDTLKKLSGHTHEVYSGITLMKKEKNKIVKILQDFDVTHVKLKKVSDKLIRKYVDAEHYKGKAGAYNISDPEFESFIEGFQGSFTNVMGLPIEKFESMLKKIDS